MGIGSIDPDESTIFLDKCLNDNPLLPKLKEALQLAMAVAEKGNVDGALSSTSKAFRGFEDALGRSSFVHYSYNPKDKQLDLVCAGTLKDEESPWGDLRNDRIRLPYMRKHSEIGKPILVNADLLTLVDPLIGTHKRSPLLDRVKEALGSSIPERAIVTGWHAGGAMATLIAPWLQMHLPAADVRLVTVDTPPVGNRWFVQALRRIVSYSYRLVHNLRDNNPLEGALDKTTLQAYTPTPITVCIVPQDQSGASAMGRATKELQGLLVNLPMKLAGNVKDRIVGSNPPKVQQGITSNSKELLAMYSMALEQVPKQAPKKGALQQVLDSTSYQAASQEYRLARKATLQRRGTMANYVEAGVLAGSPKVSTSAGSPTSATNEEVPAPSRDAPAAAAGDLGDVGDKHHHVLPDLGDVGDSPADEIDQMLSTAFAAEQISSIEHLLLLNKVRDALVYSYAAYSDEMGFREMTGLTSTTFVEDKALDSQAHIAYRAEDCTAVIACRGTESVKDAKADARISKVSLDMLPDTFPGVSVHVGFLEHFLSITREDIPEQNTRLIIEQLAAGRPVRRVLCCGHSLGGAMATLTAVWAAMTYPEADVQCITCGSPRVGNHAFKKAFAMLVGTSIRLVYRSDPVPNVPWYGYHHVDHRIFLLNPNKATFSTRPSWWKFGMGVADHFVNGYAKTVTAVTGEPVPDFCATKVKEGAGEGSGCGCAGGGKAMNGAAEAQKPSAAAAIGGKHEADVDVSANSGKGKAGGTVTAAPAAAAATAAAAAGPTLVAANP